MKTIPKRTSTQKGKGQNRYRQTTGSGVMMSADCDDALTFFIMSVVPR